MTVPFHAVSERVADILLSANYKVEMYDAENNRVYDKTQARKFFTTPENNMVTIHEAGDEKSNLNVALSQGVDIQEFEDRVGKKLRQVANRAGDNMAYDIRTYGRELQLRDFAHTNTVKEENEMSETNVTEGTVKMTGTTRSSYQKVGECRIIIRHSGKVNEDKFGARSRNIQAIFVETKGGERFRVAENNLHGARAMARHMSNGGSPFDTVGMKVSEMMIKMSGLKDLMGEVKQVGRNEIIAEDAGILAEQIKTQFNSLRETLKKMSGKVGYITHSADLAESEQLDDTGMASDAMLGKGKFAGKGHTGAPMRTSGKPMAKPTEPSEREIFAYIANSSEMGRKHMSANTDDWGPQEFELYKRAKHQLMNSAQVDGEVLEYTDPDIDPSRIGEPLLRLAYYIGEYMNTLNSDDEQEHDIFNRLSELVYKLQNQTELDPQEQELARSTAKYLNIDLATMTKNESVFESTVDTGKNDSKEKKSDEIKAQEMFTIDLGDDLNRDNAEGMHSINSIEIEKKGGSQKDYGILPENAMLESWFDDMVRVEFYKEEDLHIEEDEAPKVEKILPETALHTLNMYLEHPLFKHYIGLYENQGILDEVIDMMQYDSELYERVHMQRNGMKEDNGLPASDTMQDAFKELKIMTDERRKSLPDIIDELAAKIADENYSGNPEAKAEFEETLWKYAEESGLVKHDFGSEFADDVISPADEISSARDEVNAEQHYGDAKFSEDGKNTSQDEIDAFLAKGGKVKKLPAKKARGFTPTQQRAKGSRPHYLDKTSEENLNELQQSDEYTEVMDMHGEGLKPSMIAASLGISQDKVMQYLDPTANKLSVGSSPQIGGKAGHKKAAGAYSAASNLTMGEDYHGEHSDEKLNAVVAAYQDGMDVMEIGSLLTMEPEEVEHYLEYAGIYDDDGEPMGSYDMSDDADALGSAGMGTDEYYGDYGESVREEEKMEEELKRIAELAGVSVEEGKMDLKHDKNDDGDYDDDGEHIKHDKEDDEDDAKNESVEETAEVVTEETEEVDETADEEVDESKEEVDESTQTELERLIQISRHQLDEVKEEVDEDTEEVDEATEEIEEAKEYACGCGTFNDGSKCKCGPECECCCNAKDKTDEAKDEEVDESDDKEKVDEELATDQNLARLLTLARYRNK